MQVVAPNKSIQTHEGIIYLGRDVKRDETGAVFIAGIVAVGVSLDRVVQDCGHFE